MDKAAKEGNASKISFPRGEVKDHPYDFSFSGLKSAVLNYINMAQMKSEAINVPDLCASFEASVVDSLVSRTVKCALEYKINTVAMAGGVSANSRLREGMKEECERHGITCLYPEPIFCTDNAAMIAAAAYYEYMAGTRDDESLNALPNLPLS